MGRDSFHCVPPAEVASISELPFTEELVKPEYNTPHDETEIPSGEVWSGIIVPKGFPTKSVAQNTSVCEPLSLWLKKQSASSFLV